MADQDCNEGIVVRNRPESPVVDIVVVHGFNSSASSAWTHENGSNWVFDATFWGSLADKARVMTFGYNANAFSNAITSRIIDHSEKLLEELFYERRDQKDRPLIFIAHSMGGLVVKRALLQAKQNDRYQQLLQSASSIIFMATPHMGADRTAQLALAQRFIAWAKFSSGSHTKLSKELETFSDSIVDINRSFKPANMEIVDFYEMKETRLPSLKASALIVEPASAILPGNPNERHIPASCTHGEICKFERPEDPRFRSLWKQIDLVIDSALEATSLGERLAAPDLSAPSQSSFSIVRRSTLELQEKIDADREPESATKLAVAEEGALQQDRREARAANDRFLLHISSWKKYRQREERISRHAGTCEWIFEHRIFQKWCQFHTYEIDKSILFIVGPSGCGKSVLANHVANTLKQRYNPHGTICEEAPSTLGHQRTHPEHSDDISTKATVLRFFCKDARNNVVEAGFKASPNGGGTARASTPIIEAFLYQMLEQHRRLFSTIPSSLSQAEASVDLEDVLAIFRKILDSHQSGHVLLVIDGLDECDEGNIKELLDYLDILVRDSYTRRMPKASCLLKVLVTCQPIGPIPFWSCRYSSIHIQLQDVSQDISKYIKDEMQDIARSRNFDDNLKEVIEQTLVELADRMFLWVYFILQELRQMSVVSRAAIESVIVSFPQDLHQYYERTLARIIRAQRDALPAEQNPAMILLIIIFSQVGMTTKEVAEVLAISERRPSRKSMIDHINSDIRTLVETQLSPLVAVDDDLIVIAHYSIYQYFEKIEPIRLRINNQDITFNPDDVQGHIAMSELCLRYLLLNEFSETSNSTTNEGTMLYEGFPFLKYAASRWFFHVKRAGDHVEQLLPLLRRFLDVRSANYRLWERLHFAPHQKNTTNPITPVLSTLVRLDLASLYTLHKCKKDENVAHVIPSLWRRIRSSWLGKQTEGGDPTRLSKSLHERGRRGLMALHYATLEGNDTWLELLIDAGADVFARTTEDLSALHMAALGRDNVACAKILLRHLHPVDGISRTPFKSLGSEFTPLMVAAATGNSSLAALLLEHNARVDPDVLEGKRPLFLAAAEGYEDTALHILQYEPNLALHDSDSNNLLHFVATHGQFLLAKQIITKLEGCVDERNKFGETPLHFAAESGHDKLVTLLLDFGASLEVKTDYGYKGTNLSPYKTILGISPLEFAVRGNHTSTALLLLRKGATLQLDTCSDFTLLHIAALAGNLSLVKALQEAGIDINRTTSRGQTPLLLATQAQNASLVGYILSLSPDVNPITRPSLWTPLHTAAFAGWSEIAKLLLEHGADPGARIAHGGSTLCVAAMANQREVMELLLHHRPDLRFDSNGGTNALYIAVENRAVDCVMLLLQKGVPTVCTRKDGWQPLHRAARDGELKILTLLLDAKADINARTSLGMTALMTACEFGQEKSMDQLMNRGADPRQSKTGYGIGLLHLAAVSGKLSVMNKALDLTGTSEVDRPTALGVTPFLTACRFAGIDTMQALLAKGVDPQRLMKSGNNAVHFTALSGSPAKMRFLLNLQVPFEMKDENHDSPLDIACNDGHTEVAKVLISVGAEFQNANIYTGETCLHRSARFGRNGIASLLIAKGADLEVYDRRCLTPLLRAITHFRRSTTQLLVAAGADIDAYDSLGRTAFDIIIEQYHSLNIQHQPSLLKKRLREVVLTHIEHARTRSSVDHMDTAFLARMLLRVQDYPNATRAYLTSPVLPDPLLTSPEDIKTDGAEIEHNATCDNCQSRQNIIGARYKCLVCSDLDLCSSCKNLYDRGETGSSVCKNHDFFEIPGTCADTSIMDLHMMVFEKETHFERMLEWLDELYAKYRDMHDSGVHDNGGTSTGEANRSVTTTWMHRLCRLEVFHIKSIWAYREAAYCATDIHATLSDAEKTLAIESQD